MLYEKELEVAIAAAKEAGKKIMEIYQLDFNINYKEDTSPVTDADIASNEIIVNRLKEAFPDDGFLSEEILDDQSRFSASRFWVIDPLDGTKEFVKKNGEFAINIGLVQDGQVLLGIVYIPVKERTYYGVLGQGAYCIEQEGRRQIHTSARTEGLKVLVSRSHKTTLTKRLLETYEDQLDEVKEKGSSIKGCLIAQGDFDVYYNFGKSMKWDTCSVEIIVREAGGVFNRLDDQPIDYMEDNKVNHGFYILNRKENKMDLARIRD